MKKIALMAAAAIVSATPAFASLGDFSPAAPSIATEPAGPAFAQLQNFPIGPTNYNHRYICWIIVDYKNYSATGTSEQQAANKLIAYGLDPAYIKCRYRHQNR